MEKSVFHCSPSEWKWTSLKLPSPGTYLKTMQRVDPWYQFKTRSQKCRLFILFQAFFILDWHFEIPAPLARKKSKLSPPVLQEKILILYTSHQFFFDICLKKPFFIIFCFFIILSNHFGLDHALGRYQQMLLCRPKNLRDIIFLCA